MNSDLFLTPILGSNFIILFLLTSKKVATLIAQIMLIKLYVPEIFVLIVDLLYFILSKCDPGIKSTLFSVLRFFP